VNLKINKPKINIFEVGVGDVFTAKSKQYWGQDRFDVSLFEPNPFLYKNLVKRAESFKLVKNVKVYNVAISNEEKLGKLVCAGVLSYLTDMASPINTIFKGKLNEMLDKFIIPVNLMRIDSFDNGIDFLILGMEGAEFTVFQYLKSRPHIIILHNYFANDYGYAFPYFNFIQQWCYNNNYEIIPGIPDMTLINRNSVNSGILELN
jgi:FkbM family methyltransferase